jgi:branched-chain amino acid aminotransferase
MTFFNYNGKYYKDGEAIISPDNRGLRFGDGLFETIKAVNGKIVFANEHFNRLWKGLQLLQFEIPKLFTKEKLQQEVQALVNKNNHLQLARVRLTIIRGNGGLYDPKNHLPNYSIQSWALPSDKGNFNENGLVVGFYEEVKKSCDAFSNIKHNNFLPYTMAALFAKQNKWNDVLVLNQHNNICDSTIANVFICKDAIVYTPPLSEGCIEGITRNHLIKTLQENGFKIEETPLTKEAILNADEVFLTNAINNIKWVKQIEDKTYSNNLTQKIYKILYG